MSEKLSGWVAFLAGLISGLALGGIIVYIISLRETRTLIKSFAYDDEGRLIQVLKEHGV